MSEKKHIDRIFQEKLKDLEVAPDNAVWEKINTQLNKVKNNRKVIPIWWKLGGIAAALILLFTIGNLILTENVGSENIPVIGETDSPDESGTAIENEIPESTITESENSSDKPVELIQNPSRIESSAVESNKGKLKPSGGSESIKNKRIPVNINTDGGKTNLLADQKNNGTDTTSEVKNKTLSPPNNIQNISKETVLKDSLNKEAIVLSETEDKTNEKKIEETISNNAIEGLIVDQEKEKKPLTENVIVSSEDINEKENLNRWQVSPNFAPVYFNAFGDGSSINEQLVYNEKSGDINLSYGVNVSYAVNDRFSFRSGVNRVNLGYSTNDILIYENIGAASGSTNLFRNIKLNSAAQSLSFVSGRNLGFVQSPSIIPGESMAFLNQDMTFIEIPLELKYRLSDKQVGFSLVGGFSTLFLSNNEVSYELRGDNTILGEATNINDVSYSVNFGLGLDYKFSKNMSFNIDPMFKYQISTFNNTSGSFKPYFIGVYSGINIKF